VIVTPFPSGCDGSTGGNGDFRLDHPEVVSHGKHEIHHILAQPSAHVHLGVGDSPVLPPVADMIERRDDQGLNTLDFFYFDAVDLL